MKNFYKKFLKILRALAKASSQAQNGNWNRRGNNPG